MVLNKIKIKKGDRVKVIAGKELDKEGKVFMVFPVKNRLLIEKLNLIKRHTKPTQQQQQGGIIEKEASIHISNVMLVCPKCSKPTRVGYKILEGGDKMRACKKCGEVID
ncbi:MAG: 50S ribosomal protein L24 [Nitrospirae bacterium RBG_19FT_COMBO_42_15]|nr:MAG: 50S ribosomal protein L24 [Nitrospirae bacterium RBG_19FT_COMBO_42_15]